MAQKNTMAKAGAMAGVAAAAAMAAAAGAYWLYGAKNASKNRKMARSWMLKARAEVMDAVEKAKHLDKETYMGIVDKVVKGYSAVAGARSKEVRQLVSDLQGAWSYIQAQQGPATKRAQKVKKSATRAVKSLTKKRR